MHFPLGPLKRLHLDKAAVKANADAVITIRCNDRKFTVRKAVIMGPSQFVVNMELPLQPEGTYAWVETTAAVMTID